MPNTTTQGHAPAAVDPVDPLVHLFIRFLETGKAPEGLFAEDVFVDFTMPLWRRQARGRAGLEQLRRAGHPDPGSVPRWRADPTARGFVIEFEESWLSGGQQWISREMARADVADGAIAELSVYCTGDWDEALQQRHAAAERLIRS